MLQVPKRALDTSLLLFSNQQLTCHRRNIRIKLKSESGAAVYFYNYKMDVVSLMQE